jgi:molybdate transport system ATP-binding protein
MALSDRDRVAGAAALRARICKRLGSGEAAAFQIEVEFEAPAGITILFGASGAGKTTILHCIAGLQKPNEGSISIGAAGLFDSAAGVDLPLHRRQVGYLFQTLALFPHMSVEHNVRYGLATLSAGERDGRVSDVLNSFHIADLARRRPGEISGGERQRVALARTLVTRPRVLLLDEPLSALDLVTKARIVADLRAWNQRFRIPILYVTHDRSEVFALAEQMLVLNKGRIIAQGLPQDVLHRPEMESVAQLAGFENVFDCAVVERHPEQGTMACRIASSQVDLEVPLTRVHPEQPLRVGIRAGDILVSIVRPQGLSARNVIEGTITSLEQRDVMAIARVDCGAVFEVHLTPGAVRSLPLAVGAHVWLVIKTYSCLVLQGTPESEA